MATARRFAVVHFPAGLALDWESWAIYPQREAPIRVDPTLGDTSAWAFRQDDDWLARCKAVCFDLAARLYGTYDAVEVLSFGHTPYVAIHDTGADTLRRHRRLQP